MNIYISISSKNEYSCRQFLDSKYPYNPLLPLLAILPRIIIKYITRISLPYSIYTGTSIARCTDPTTTVIIRRNHRQWNIVGRS